VLVLSLEVFELSTRDYLHPIGYAMSGPTLRIWFFCRQDSNAFLAAPGEYMPMNDKTRKSAKAATAGVRSSKSELEGVSFSDYRRSVENQGLNSAAEKYREEIQSARQVSERDLAVVINAVG
jgi:hypothetical protein